MSDEATIHGFKRGDRVKVACYDFTPYDFTPGTVIALSEARMKRRLDARPLDSRFVWVEHDNGSVSGWFPRSLRKLA